MNASPSSAARPGRAFTLVEILAALSVLAMIIVLAAQILGATLRATGASTRKMDATQRCRFILDAVGNDLAGLVSGNGMTVFARVSGNDAILTFATQGRGPNSSSSDFRLLAVNYVLSSNRLLRSSTAVTWSEADLVTALVTPSSAGTAGLVADDVLRFEAMALLDDGRIVPLSATGTWTSSTANGKPLSGYTALVLSRPPVDAGNPRVRSLLVAVAALDDQTFALPRASAIASALPAAQTGQPPADLWNTALFSKGGSPFPKPALAALHLDQRTYPLR